MHFIVLVSAGGTTAEQVRGKSLLGVEDSDTVMQSSFAQYCEVGATDTLSLHVLQKLGKADETKDEQFEEYVQNFKRQEVSTLNSCGSPKPSVTVAGFVLLSERKSILVGMQEASMKLTESLHEVYEPDWYGREDVKMVGEKCDVLWEDFHQKLVDGSLLTLDTYLGQFPDIKNRIAKRSRKLVDYDSARHHLEALQSSKRKDESRISKLCHKLYEVMTKLGDQHADKAFTIQGAPRNEVHGKRWLPYAEVKGTSTSGSFNVAESDKLKRKWGHDHLTNVPLVFSNVPRQIEVGTRSPDPLITPTKELQQENIISFFEDNFVPEISVTTPSQQNEVPEVKKEETLLDLDFDPFKPEVAPAGSAGVTHSPMSQTDSSKSLSLCNLIMEETPDSGLAEEIQRSQIDLGALMWGPDASTESVSQELPQGGSQEDSACVSEAERDVGLSTGMLPSADWHTVAEEGEHVLGPAPLCRSEQLLPEPVPGAEFAMAASVELEQPYDLPDSEIPAMETGGLVQESQEAVKKSEEEEDQQKIQDSIWAGVETCEKVDTGAVGIKALEGQRKSLQTDGALGRHLLVTVITAATRSG
ncbi:Amphiphysin-like protein [Camelus ferus]|nr:Amphiphysin-like protein [Camelus ferus]